MFFQCSFTLCAKVELKREDSHFLVAPNHTACSNKQWFEPPRMFRLQAKLTCQSRESTACRPMQCWASRTSLPHLCSPFLLLVRLVWPLEVAPVNKYKQTNTQVLLRYRNTKEELCHTLKLFAAWMEKSEEITCWRLSRKLVAEPGRESTWTSCNSVPQITQPIL